MPPISSHTTYLDCEENAMKNNSGFILRKIYNQYLLFPVRANEVGNELISLNEVGADIWNLALDGKTEKDIIVQIKKIYGIESGSVEEEAIVSFVDTLCEQKLLHRHEEDM